MARYDVEIDPKKFEAGADKITNAIKEMAKSGQAAGEQLDAALENVNYDAEAEKIVRAQRKQERSAKSLEFSVRLAADAYKQLASAGNALRGGGGGGAGAGGGRAGGAGGGGDSFDLSAAFERDAQDIIRNDRHLTTVQQQELNKRVANQRQAFEKTDLSAAFERNSQDIIRQDRHLTNIQQQERKTRISNERQGQQEVSRILTSATRDREAAERGGFQRNRQLRDANTKQSQTSATNAVDALFTSSNQQNNIRANRAQRDAKIEQDLEKEIKRVTRSASNAFKQQASEINRSRRQIEVGLLELFFTLHSLSKPISDITNALAAFTAQNVRAAAEVQKYASTLNIVSGNSATAKRVLDSLLDVTVELAAIDTPGLIQFSSRLQHADFTAQQAENAIVAVTRRMEEQGKGAAITNRVLEQFAQAINADLISMQDFRPILREYPGLYKDFSAALGTTITDMDSLRAAADQAGGATQAIAIALDYVSTVAQGAELDTINRQLDEFKDRIFNLQRALGDVLLPNLVQLLKSGNRLLELLQDMGETARVFTQVLALMALGIGKVIEGFIQLGIISVVVIQIRTAVNQINSAAQSLNNLAAVANNTTAAVVALPKDFQRISRVMSTLQRILPAIAVGFTALLVIIPTLTAAFAKITQQVRLMRQETKDFDSVQRQIPKSINEGSAAIKSQTKDLKEYRLDLQKTRDELERLIAGPKVNKTFSDSINLVLSDIAVLTGGAERLSNLDSQIESVTKNISQLLIVGNEDLPIKTRLFELIGVIENINKQLALARLDEAFDVEGAADRIRRLEASLLSVQNAFRIINEEANKKDAVANYAEELIKIDFVIRRLERSSKQVELGEIFKGFDVGQVQRDADSLIALIEKEAELKRKLANEEADGEKELALDLLKIKEQLSFDTEKINEDAADKTKEIDLSILNLARENARLIVRSNEDAEQQRYASKLFWNLRHRQLEYDRAKDSIDALQSVLGFQQDLLKRQFGNFEVGITPSSFDSGEIRKNYDERRTLIERQSQLDIDLVNKEVVGQSEKDIKIRAIERKRDIDIGNARRETSDKIQVLELEAFQENRRLSRLIVDSNYEAEQQKHADRLYWAGRHGEIDKERAEKELKEFQKTIEARRLLLEHSPAATEGRDNAQRNRERLGEILELSDAIERESRSIISSNNRIINQFSRGISRSLSDFVFEGKETFGEFLLEFAKMSFRVIVQSRIQAEIQKRVSDDLTRHQIINIQKVAAVQLAAGATTTSLGASGLAALSPVASIFSGGVGTAVLIGLSIAPFLVRAIKDGFDDTSVNIDKREVGKISASSVSRLVREGRVRL